MYTWKRFSNSILRIAKSSFVAFSMLGCSNLFGQISLVRQVPYSPDKAPCNFWLFPKFKRPLKDTRFDKDIIENATRELSWQSPRLSLKSVFRHGRIAGTVYGLTGVYFERD